MEKSFKEKMLEGLLNIKQGENFNKQYGICRNIGISMHGDAYSDFFSSWCKKWPKFSGKESFPVPSPNSKLPASLEYFKSEDDGTLWNKNTSYGSLRWELVDFLINELQNSEGQ